MIVAEAVLYAIVAGQLLFSITLGAWILQLKHHLSITEDSRSELLVRCEAKSQEIERLIR